MGKHYRATAEANSRNPQDWGRAMAWAMSELSTQALADESPERLFGQDLTLRVTPTDDGVEIALDWDAPDHLGDGDLAGVERTDTGAIIIEPTPTPTPTPTPDRTPVHPHAGDDERTEQVEDPEEGAAHPT